MVFHADRPQTLLQFASGFSASSFLCGSAHPGIAIVPHPRASEAERRNRFRRRSWWRVFRVENRAAMVATVAGGRSAGDRPPWAVGSQQLQLGLDLFH
jgi:hypothetical protein